MTSQAKKSILNKIELDYLKTDGLTEEDLIEKIIESVDWVRFLESNFKDPDDSDLPLRLYNYQKKIISRINYSYNPYKKKCDKGAVLKIGRQYGKTSTMIFVMVCILLIGWTAKRPPIDVHIVSLSDDKSKELMRRVIRFIKASPFKHYINERTGVDMKQKRVTLLNGSRMNAWSHTNENIRGEPVPVLILDETAKMKDSFINGAARPALRKVGILEILASTPFGNRNEFAKSLKKTDLYHVFDLRDNVDNNKFLVPWMTREQFDDEWAKLGGGALAKQELLGELIESESSVFRPEWIQNSYLVDSQRSLQPFGIDKFKYVMGIDFGKHRDWTVITVVHNEGDKIYLDWIEAHRKKDLTIFVRERILKLARKFPLSLIVPDSTGAGDTALEIISREAYLPFFRMNPRGKRSALKNRIGFYFTPETKKDLIELLALEYQMGRIRIPYHEDCTNYTDPKWQVIQLERELLDFEYELLENASNLRMPIRYKHPEGKHDDRLIALALAVFGVRKRIWHVVGALSDQITDEVNKKYKPVPKQAYRQKPKGTIKNITSPLAQRIWNRVRPIGAKNNVRQRKKKKF